MSTSFSDMAEVFHETVLFLALLWGSFAFERFFSCLLFPVATIRSILARCCSVLFKLSRAPFSLLNAILSRSFPGSASTQLFSWGVVFWAVCRPRIHSLCRFLSTSVFFGLAVFSGSVLSNFQGCFHILLWGGGGGGGCSCAFLSLVKLLVSAVLWARFSYSSWDFSWVFCRAFLLSGSVLSRTS